MADTGVEISARAVQWIVTGIKAAISRHQDEPYRRIKVITAMYGAGGGGRTKSPDHDGVMESLAPGA